MSEPKPGPRPTALGDDSRVASGELLMYETKGHFAETVGGAKNLTAVRTKGGRDAS